MSRSTRNKMGRPLAENPKNDQVRIRMTKAQKEKLLRMAKEMNMSMSELILRSLGIED